MRPDFVARPRSPCHPRGSFVRCRPVQGIKTTLFFLFWTVLGAAGVVMATKGQGIWLLVVGFLVYLGMLIKWGCLTEPH